MTSPSHYNYGLDADECVFGQSVRIRKSKYDDGSVWFSFTLCEDATNSIQHAVIRGVYDAGEFSLICIWRLIQSSKWDFYARPTTTRQTIALLRLGMQPSALSFRRLCSNVHPVLTWAFVFNFTSNRIKKTKMNKFCPSMCLLRCVIVILFPISSTVCSVSTIVSVLIRFTFSFPNLELFRWSEPCSLIEFVDPSVHTVGIRWCHFQPSE